MRQYQPTLQPTQVPADACNIVAVGPEEPVAADSSDSGAPDLTHDPRPGRCSSEVAVLCWLCTATLLPSCTLRLVQVPANATGNGTGRPARQASSGGGQPRSAAWLDRRCNQELSADMPGSVLPNSDEQFLLAVADSEAAADSHA